MLNIQHFQNSWRGGGGVGGPKLFKKKSTEGRNLELSHLFRDGCELMNTSGEL